MYIEKFRSSANCLLGVLVLSATMILHSVQASSLSPEGKYYFYLPEEVLKLSDEQKRSDLPMAYKVGSEEQIYIMKIASKILLDNLRYPSTFDNAEAAIKLFQKDLGDPETGELSIGQIFLLGKRSSFYDQSKTDVTPLGNSLTAQKDEYLDGYASVEGSLKILGEQIAYPINKVEITCDRDSGECSYSQVDVQDSADFKTFLNSFGETIYISTYETEYRILSWGKNEIVAAPYERGGPVCRSEILTLNFETEEFVLTSTNKNIDSEMCKDIKMDRPRVSQIVDGFKEASARNKERAKVANALLYSGYQKQMEELIEEVRSKLGD